MNRIYMESSCFIDVAKYKLGYQHLIDDLAAREEHIQYCIKMLKAAEFNDLRVLTANLTVSECKYINGRLDDEIKRLFRSILSSGRIVRLVTDNIFIGEIARDFLWEHDIHFKRGADGIHVATALYSNCGEFITYDKGILKNAPKLEKLGIRAITADQTKLLPRQYIDPPEEAPELQSDLFSTLASHNKPDDDESE